MLGHVRMPSPGPPSAPPRCGPVPGIPSSRRSRRGGH